MNAYSDIPTAYSGLAKRLVAGLQPDDEVLGKRRHNVRAISILVFSMLTAQLLAAPSGLYNYRLNTASTNLTASFPTVAQFSGPTTAFAEVDINNGSATDIEVNCAATSVPSSNASNSFYVPAGISYNSSTTVAVQAYMGNKCWFRSTSGTISSGVITAIGYGY
jgi:hypothetical protein